MDSEENGKTEEINSNNNSETDGKIKELKNTITNFLSGHTVYEAIPENMKILVFNEDLLIKDSIKAMVKEDIYCGLLWSTSKNTFIGIFTIRDILGLLVTTYKQLVKYLNDHEEIDSISKLKEKMDDFFETFETKEGEKDESKMEKMEIEGEKGDENGASLEEEESNFNKIVHNFEEFYSLFSDISLLNYKIKFKPFNENLLTISLDDSLKMSIEQIRNNRIHRLIVMDKNSNSVSGFITYETIFEYFIKNYFGTMNEFDFPLKCLDITTKNILFLNKTDSLLKCMELFYEKKISMVPVKDNNNNDLYGYIYLKDIIYCFSGGLPFNFNNTIEEFLSDLYAGIDMSVPLGEKRITDVYLNTKIKEIFELMSVCPERKLIVRDIKNNEDDGISDIGIITLYDIFKLLVS